jgi:amino acid transporter, AAT family
MATMSELLKEEQLHEEKDLVRGLKNRHIQMIAIGGAIGVGLFLGSARAIQLAGPALIFSYTLVGIMIFLIMRALGELLLYRPVAGSFATYAEEFTGPWAGFFTGWSYWFMWVVTGMAEVTAVAVYVNYWWPDVPQWLPALITLALLYGVNLIAVGFFGEFEFWFAIIKVVTIIALIIIGLVIILFGFGELGQMASFSNLWAHGGFFPLGAVGVILSLQVVTFAFLGVELVGVTAGECQNPQRCSQTRSTPWYGAS